MAIYIAPRRGVVTLSHLACVLRFACGLQPSGPTDASLDERLVREEAWDSGSPGVYAQATVDVSGDVSLGRWHDGSDVKAQETGHTSSAGFMVAQVAVGAASDISDVRRHEATSESDLHHGEVQDAGHASTAGLTAAEELPASMLVAMSAADAHGYRKTKCTLPQGLDVPKLAEAESALEDEHQFTTHTHEQSVSQLMHQIASTNKKTNAFLWQHWGDSDMMILPPGGQSSSMDGQDYSQCSGQIAREIWSGQTLPDPTPNSGKIINAFGAFFSCKENHKQVFDDMTRFLKTNPVAKFPFYDAFYLPVGDESSPIEGSWVKAAKAGNRPVVLVGPKHLGSLHAMLNYQKHFEISLPTEGCGDIDRLAPQMVEYSRKSFPDQSVLFVVAGALIGKGIAYRAFQKLHDKDIMVDVGSSLDGFAGRASRDYNQDIRAKYCQSSKTWMSCEACKSACIGIRESEPCSCSIFSSLQIRMSLPA